ncbi:hypothetical protein [Paenibacillus piri]|uniref:Uncharacterized protein n=1 Tax=Paenibacillus piri TaxID=2547395 RepID=A0A4R5KQI7_9BACL|nr:hypothetical protein [Paenibacillus piri]TDF97592.1 hypothetical protein E1757_13370 [Paenibacillus piri]
MRMTISRQLLLIIAMAAGLTGCSKESPSHEAAVRPEAAAHASSQVIALDVSEEGTMKLTSLPNRGITALSDAGTPLVVLLGSGFVRRHGTVPAYGLPRQLPQSPAGTRPVIAMVDGQADLLMNRAPAAEWLPELERLAEELAGFRQRRDGMKRDAVMPYLSRAGGAAGVQVQAAVLRGREPALLLNGQELELLACLDGQALEGMSCRTAWSSNGDLRAPVINASVTVTAGPGAPQALRGPAAADSMAQRMSVLLRSLQLQGADPLDIGQTVRSLYRGAWTGERWRTALTRASIEVRVHMSS